MMSFMCRKGRFNGFIATDSKFMRRENLWSVHVKSGSGLLLRNIEKVSGFMILLSRQNKNESKDFRVCGF